MLSNRVWMVGVSLVAAAALMATACGGGSSGASPTSASGTPGATQASTAPAGATAVSGKCTSTNIVAKTLEVTTDSGKISLKLVSNSKVRIDGKDVNLSDNFGALLIRCSPDTGSPVKGFYNAGDNTLVSADIG